MYDNENWAQTPTAEKQDPVTYMQDFIAKCHLYPRYNAIMAPGYGLFSVVTVIPADPRHESQEDWFVRVIVGMGATGCDMFVLQNESLQRTSTGAYASLFNNTADKMATVSPGKPVFAEVASDFATGADRAGPRGGHGHLRAVADQSLPWRVLRRDACRDGGIAAR